MKKWQYHVVAVEVFDIGDAIKHRGQRAQLDADVSDDDWMRTTWKRGRADVGRVVLSPRGCYTRPSTALNEWGQEGWEIAGITPALRSFFGGQSADYVDINYAIWLKRPEE